MVTGGLMADLTKLITEYYNQGGVKLVAKAAVAKGEAVVRGKKVIDKKSPRSQTQIELNGTQYKVKGGWPPHKWRWYEWNVLMPGVKTVMRKYLYSGAKFVDVGSAMGDTALFACSLGADPVVAFEPNTLLYEDLVGNIERNAVSRVIHENVAVGDTSGLIPVDNVVGETFDGYDGGSSHNIQTITLDDYLSNTPDLIKIDVDGAEYRVLKGASQYLGEVPILLELHHTEMLDDWKETVNLIFDRADSITYVNAQGSDTTTYQYGDVLTSESRLAKDIVHNILIE